jgi:hypothetical protein
VVVFASARYVKLFFFWYDMTMLLTFIKKIKSYNIVICKINFKCHTIIFFTEGVPLPSAVKQSQHTATVEGKGRGGGGRFFLPGVDS